MLPHALLSLLVFKHSFIQIYFGIFDFFCFCFVSNKYYLILLNFTSYLFSVKKKIYWLETYIMKLKCLGKSVSLKYFMFHKMLLNLYFTKCSERKISQCIFASTEHTEKTHFHSCIVRVGLDLTTMKLIVTTNLFLPFQIFRSHFGSFLCASRYRNSLEIIPKRVI